MWTCTSRENTHSGYRRLQKSYICLFISISIRQFLSHFIKKKAAATKDESWRGQNHIKNTDSLWVTFSKYITGILQPARVFSPSLPAAADSSLRPLLLTKNSCDIKIPNVFFAYFFHLLCNAITCFRTKVWVISVYSSLLQDFQISEKVISKMNKELNSPCTVRTFTYPLQSACPTYSIYILSIIHARVVWLICV